MTLVSRSLAAAAVAVALALSGCSSASSSKEVIKGVFKDASPLEKGSEVRADGVLVGTVSDIQLDRSKGVAIVSLEVEDQVLPVHDDARMILKPINLLGENYLELDPGSPERPYLRGDFIDSAHTENAVTLQGLLDTFDDPTSAGLAALVLTTGEGLRGNGENTAEVIRALAPAMEDIDRLGDILHEQNAVLNSLVEKADPVATALTTEEGQDLDRVISSLTTTLKATRDKQAAMAKTLEELPGTIKEARKTFSSLEELSSELGPTLKKARPVTSDLSDISEEIIEFSKYADPAFNGFDELFAALDDLLREAAPVAKSLHQNESHLVQITKAVELASDELLWKHRRELMTFVRYWALSTNGRDAASHYFRGVFHVTPNTLQQLLGSQTPAGLVPAGTDAAGPAAAKSDAKGGNVVDDVKGAVDGVTGTVGGVVGGVTSGGKQSTPRPDDGATGLTPEQEEGLLGRLLGGLG